MKTETLSSTMKDFTNSLAHSYSASCKNTALYYCNRPMEFRSPALTNNRSKRNGWRTGIALFLTTPLVFGLGLWKGMDAWIGYTSPPDERIVYLRNGKPSYEVVRETSISTPITNWYSGQKLVGDMPIRRGER